MKWIKRITLGGLATLGAVVLGIIVVTFGVAVVQGWGKPRAIPGENEQPNRQKSDS